MNIEVVHFEDEKYISRRPKVEDFISEYTSFLKENGNRKNPYRDPDNCGTCSALYDMSEKLWGEKLPETWGTDQLGFSADAIRKMLDNIRCLVNKRSNEIHSNNRLGTSL